MVASATSSDSLQVAQLHHSAIKAGFLSRLGIGFLNSLYKYLIKKEIVLVYREGETIRGFVSCALNSDKIMRKFVFNPEGVLSFLVAILKRPGLLFTSVETMLIPLKNKSAGRKKIGPKLPEAELLSISVDPGFQQDGIGSSLLAELEKRLQEKGVQQYKVVAGANLIAANKFYLKHGFHLADEMIIHGKDISNIYCKSLL